MSPKGSIETKIARFLGRDNWCDWWLIPDGRIAPCLKTPESLSFQLGDYSRLICEFRDGKSGLVLVSKLSPNQSDLPQRPKSFWDEDWVDFWFSLDFWFSYLAFLTTKPNSEGPVV